MPLASFEIGSTDFAALALALYLPVFAAVLLARAWRLTWAIRSALMVLVFGGLAVLADGGSVPIDMPEAGVLLVPVAVGRLDLRGRSARSLRPRRPRWHTSAGVNRSASWRRLPW